MHNTIDFFRELSSIPRESGKESKIADYIETFALDNNLDYQRDKYNNIIIYKYIDGKDPVILQCHLDMVCVKDEDKVFDFNKDSIELIERDGYLCANGTTLGADNGIGVAQILNILANEELSIEAIFTTNEETTMEGAMNIDLKRIKGRKMINLDGFNSDTILIESASFTDIDIRLNYNYEKNKKNLYKITIDGLKGGHSGFDIDDDRGNSIIFLSQILLHLDNIKIADFVGGTKINVIPSSAYAIIETSSDLSNINNVRIEKLDEDMSVLSYEDSVNLLNFLANFKHGVFNKNNRGEVTTSMNLATIELKKNLITVGLRSSIEDERQDVLKYLENYCGNYELIIRGFQPGFRTSEDSNVVKNLVEAYRAFNDNNSPKIESVHISVEVGLIAKKIPNLDVAIISPNIIGAHSTEEKVEIDSINRCDRWLKKFLYLFEG